MLASKPSAVPFADRGEGSRMSKEEKTILILAAIEILRRQNPMTLRQLFYKMVGELNPTTGKGWLENSKSEYDKLGDFMGKDGARGNEKYPQLPVDEWLEDHTRPDYFPGVYDDEKQFVGEALGYYYRKNLWTTQPNYIELWTEKDALINTIKPLTYELGIKVRVTRGYISISKAKVIRKELLAKQNQGKKVIVFFAGDFDPAGMDIEREMLEQIRGEDNDLTIWHTRLFILPPKPATYNFDTNELIDPGQEGDMAHYNLLPLPAKEKDTKTPAFIKKYGNADCCELDALDPDIIRQRIREEVEGYRDMTLWKAAFKREAKEKRNIAKNLTKWKYLDPEPGLLLLSDGKPQPRKRKKSV
jgi:hypothetical protein